MADELEVLGILESAPSQGRASAAADFTKRAELAGACWRCDKSTLLSTLSSDTGNPPLIRAAVSSMARALAPASRSCAQEFAMAELPPVPWILPKTRLA
jgi:hypothetical protein